MKQLLRLLTDPHSSKLYARHQYAVNTLIETCSQGFCVSDLSLLSKILSACYQLSVLSQEMEDALLALVKQCAKRLHKQKTSDEKNFKQNAIKYIQTLGTLLDTSNSVLLIEVCGVISEYYTLGDINPGSIGKRDNAKNIIMQDNIRPVNHTFYKDILEKSHIAKEIASLLQHDSSLQDNTLSCCLSVLSCLSHSVSCAESILTSGMGSRIVIIMNEVIEWGRENQQKGTSIEFIQTLNLCCNLLENGSRSMIQAQLSNYECVDIFHQCLLKLLTSEDASTNTVSYSKSRRMKALRNDMVVLISQLMQHSPNGPYVETGLLQTLAILCSSSEVPEQYKGTQIFAPDGSQEDFELKKLLLSIIAFFSDQSAAILLFTNLPILSSLFFYIPSNINVQSRASGPESSKSMSRRLSQTCLSWNSEQTEELQLLSLSVLSILAGKLPEQYCACQGNSILFNLLDWSLSEYEHFSHATSILSHPHCRGTKRAQMSLCLRTLLGVSSFQIEQVNQELLDMGILQLLILYLNSMDPSSIDSIDVDTMSDVLLLISLLCENEERAKEMLCNIGGVSVLIRYLLVRENLFSAGLGHSKLFLHALDCLWTCVVGFSFNEEQFLAEEGVFILLDCLYTHPTSMKSVILAVLVDLTDNSRSLFHLHAWQSTNTNSTNRFIASGALLPPIIPNGSISHASSLYHDPDSNMNSSATNPIGVWSLLAMLWREEEASLGVYRTNGIIIADYNAPMTTTLSSDDNININAAMKYTINNTSSSEQYSQTIKDTSSSQAILDVAQNSRAKIYALCERLDFRNMPKDITGEERATLLLIERYLDLKTGEVWKEIINELEQDNIRPVEHDRNGLNEILSVNTLKTKQIIQLQTDFVNLQEHELLQNERRFFLDIQANHLMAETKQAEFDEFLERTSNIVALRNAREKQRVQIAGSRRNKAIELNDNFHPTDLSKLHTTIFCGRNVRVENYHPLKFSDNSHSFEVSSHKKIIS